MRNLIMVFLVMLVIAISLPQISILFQEEKTIYSFDKDGTSVIISWKTNGDLIVKRKDDSYPVTSVVNDYYGSTELLRNEFKDGIIILYMKGGETIEVKTPYISINHNQE